MPDLDFEFGPNFWFAFGSALRGLQVMKLRNSAKWYVRWMPRRVWCQFWTPVWHEGRGPYLTCGCWLFAIYRGY